EQTGIAIQLAQELSKLLLIARELALKPACQGAIAFGEGSEMTIPNQFGGHFSCGAPLRKYWVTGLVLGAINVPQGFNVIECLDVARFDSGVECMAGQFSIFAKLWLIKMKVLRPFLLAGQRAQPTMSQAISQIRIGIAFEERFELGLWQAVELSFKFVHFNNGQQWIHGDPGF